MNTKQKNILELIIRLLMSLVFLAFLQGCFSNGKHSENFGNIVGNILEAKNQIIIAKNDDIEVPIQVDDAGNFFASLPQGSYNLFFNTKSGLQLIEKSVQVINNMTVNLVDIDMVPIPRLASVVISIVDSTTAVIIWETDIDSDGFLEYGVNELYGYSTHANEVLSKKHRIQLEELTPDTKYHFRVISTRHGLESTKAISKDYSFTTAP